MRFYGQWNPPVDKVLYESYFKDKEGGFFIEAGAHDGKTGSCCKFFEEFKGWDGLNIEPDPYLFPMLEKNRPDSNNINLALSDKKDTIEFTHVVHPRRKHHFGNGSVEHTEKHRKRLENINCKFETSKVKSCTYKELIEICGVKEVDLFVLDVEGHEIKVIKGMDGTTVWPKVMCIEHMHCGDELEKVMKLRGYKLDQKVFGNSYYVFSL